MKLTYLDRLKDSKGIPRHILAPMGPDPLPGTGRGLRGSVLQIGAKKAMKVAKTDR